MTAFGIGWGREAKNQLWLTEAEHNEVSGHAQPNPLTAKELPATTTEIAAGAEFALALLEDGTLRAIGGNGEGGTCAQGTGEDHYLKVVTPKEKAKVLEGTKGETKTTGTEKEKKTFKAVGEKVFKAEHKGMELVSPGKVPISSKIEVIISEEEVELNEPAEAAGTGITFNIEKLQALSTTVKAIAAHGNKWIAVMTDHTIRTCGQNKFGELGNGESGEWNQGVRNPNKGVERAAFKPSGITTAEKCFAGPGTLGFITTTGTVFMAGESLQGQQGHGDKAEHRTFTEVPVLKEIAQVSCGGTPSQTNHTLALTTTGKVFASGDQTYYQLGNEVKSSTPKLEFEEVTQLKFASKIVAVQAVWAGSYVLLENGELLSWGWDKCGPFTSGQLGRNEGEGPFPKPKLILGTVEKPVKKISCIQGFGFAVQEKKAGEHVVFSWGGYESVVTKKVTSPPNKYGELGNGELGTIPGKENEVTHVIEESPNAVKKPTESKAILPDVTQIAALEFGGLAISTTEPTGKIEGGNEPIEVGSSRMRNTVGRVGH